MRDQNTRAMLIEAVIAGGLVAVGIATGQPLVAIASSAAGVGGNWVYSLADRGFHHWRDQWFTDDGVLNHDIAKALCNSYAAAIQQLEHDWQDHRQYKHLRRKYPEKADLTMSTLRYLREDEAVFFQQMSQIVQVIQKEAADKLAVADKQDSTEHQTEQQEAADKLATKEKTEHKLIFSMMYQDKTVTSEYLKTQLVNFLHDHDQEFVEFVSTELGPKWILRFLEILKDPGPAGTRAWRACQLLWQKSLMNSIEQIKENTTETVETVRWLKDWAQQLKSLPPTERNLVGQDGLDNTLRSVQNQLSAIQNQLSQMQKQQAEAFNIADETRGVAVETRDTAAATLDTTLGIQTKLNDLATTLGTEARSRATTDKNRLSLLNIVQTTWISKFYVNSIKGADFVHLGLYERPDLVENAWETQVSEMKSTERPLPLGTEITEVFDSASGELLILGEPGSGKTTLLLHLTNELIERAKLDKDLPIPAVFNLSSWSDKHQPLDEWLVEELHTKYKTPPRLGKPWIENDEILPILDGLDEVALQYRSACVKAINVFRQKQGQSSSIVVGCRLAEYTKQDEKLALQQAVYVQPMTLDQIYDYLGSRVGLLQDSLRKEPAFQSLAQNPMMLSVLKQTYQGKNIQFSENDSPIARRQQIFDDYVKFALRRRKRAAPYTPEQTKEWLIWLATKLYQSSKTIFYLEQMQISWLNNVRSGEIFTSLAFSLLSFPIAVSLLGLEYSAYGFNFALANGFLAGLLVAIIAFFFVLSIETGFRLTQLLPNKKLKEKLFRYEEEEKERKSKSQIFLTLQFWERVCFAIISGLLLGILVQVLVGPLYSVVNGIFFVAFLIVLGTFDKEIQPAEKLIWSRERFLKNAPTSFLIGMGIGVLGGLSDAYPYFQHLPVFLTTLYFWLCLGATLSIIIMIMRGNSKDEIDKSKREIKPNEGIRNSLYNSLKVGLPSGLMLGLVVFVFYSYVIHKVFVVGYLNEIPEDSYIIYSIGDALAVFYLFWLINGGFACMQHFVLRFLLWRTKRISWQYSHFLDYAVDRNLLRKIGGGYTFMHKLLRDYFVGLNATQIFAEEQTSTTLSSVTKKLPEGEQESLILVPTLSDKPVALPCGHEQSNLQAQFCFVCGRPVPPALFEAKTPVPAKYTNPREP